MNDEEQTFGEWLEAKYHPDQNTFTEEDMEEAWTAGRQTGWDAAEDYLAQGGSFK